MGASPIMVVHDKTMVDRGLTMVLTQGISLCCGLQRKHFLTYYFSFKLRCHSLNILGVKRWGPNQPPPPPGPRRPKKPGLNRVKGSLSRFFNCRFPLPSMYIFAQGDRRAFDRTQNEKNSQMPIKSCGLR